MTHLVEEERTHSIIGAYFEVYNTLGFGFLESIYVSSLERELLARGHEVGREVQVRVCYKNEEVGLHRLDMVVDERIAIEVKSTQELHKSAFRQVLNYLRATNMEVGMLLHFGPEPKFFRMVNQRAGASRVSVVSASSA